MQRQLDSPPPPSLISIGPRAESNNTPQTPLICTHGLRTDSVQRNAWCLLKGALLTSSKFFVYTLSPNHTEVNQKKKKPHRRGQIFQSRILGGINK